MADNDRPRMSTCPICGYTDTSDDTEVLQMAIEEHIRMTHNLDPATLGGTAGAVKLVSNETAAEVSGNNTNEVNIPVIAAIPNINGVGANGAGAGFGGGAGLLAAEAVNDVDATTPKRKDDETSRF